MHIEPPATATLPLPTIFPFCTKYIEAAWRHCCNGFGNYHACCCYNDCHCLQANQSIVIEYIPDYIAKKSCSQITKYYCRQQHYDILWT